MWRHAIVVLILATASIAVLPARVAAQAVSSFDELKSRVRADQTVYVRTAAIEDENGRGVKGKVLDIQGSLLRLQVKGKHREFEQRNVLTVSERYDRGGRGAVIGLAIGAGLGAWYYSATCAGSQDAESCAVAELLLGVGIGVGTLMGYEVGHSIEHERVLFARPGLGSRSLSVAPQLGPSRASLAATLRF